MPRMRFTWLLAVFTVLLLALPFLLDQPQALAATFRWAPTPTIAADETIPGDLYLMGAQVEVDGHVKGDLLVAGGAVTVRGPIDGDLVVLAGTVTVFGPVGHTMRAAGSQVRVAAPVGGDLLVAAGQVDTQPPLVVGGQTFVRATDQTLAGELGQALMAHGENVVLAAEVAGPVDVVAPRLVVAPEARIDGALRMETLTPNPLDPRSVIRGGVVTNPLRSRTAWGAFWPWLLRWCTALLVGLLILYVVPHTAALVADNAMRRPHWRMLAGLGMLFGAPLVAIMGMLTIIALPLGLMLLGLYFACLYLAQLVVAWGAARWVLLRAGDAETHWKQALGLALSLVVLTMLKALPVVGVYLNFFIVLWGLGAITIVVYRWWRGHEAKT